MALVGSLIALAAAQAAPASALAQQGSQGARAVTLTGELSAIQKFTSIDHSTLAWTLRVGQTRYPVSLNGTVVDGAGPAFIAAQSYPASGPNTIGTELNGAVVSITGLLAPNGKLLTAKRTHVVQLAGPGGAKSPEGFLDKVGSAIRTYGPIVFEALLAFALLFVIFAMRGSMPRIGSSRIKPTTVGDIGWGDIAGCDEAKEELREVTEFFSNPQRFAATGARVPRGFLLTGPPGTGKTLLAKALARQTGAAFYYMSASNLTEIFVGVGPKKLRKLFAVARKHAPAIIFLDEIDAAGKRRGHDFVGEDDKTLNQLLMEMDGFTEHDQVVVIAATNRPESLDPALLRPGRFDRRLVVAVPDRAGREQILNVHTRNKPLSPKVSLVAHSGHHERPLRSGPREPLQRGSDLRRSRGARGDHHGGLLAGVQPRDGGSRDAQGGQRRGEAHPRLSTRPATRRPRSCCPTTRPRRR